MSDKVKAIRPQVELSEDQAGFVGLMRELYEASLSGALREFHGVLVYFEEGEISRLTIGAAGDMVAMASEIACDLYDLGDAIREERREELEDEEEGEE